MKKIFKLMTVALVAMCGFTSCDKDCEHDFIEVDYSKKLAGTWTCVDAENEFAEALIFNADGSVTSTGVFEGGYYEKKGTYKIKGNQMTLSFEDGDYMESRFEMVEGEVFSLVDDELDVHFNYNYCENDLSKEIVGMWVSTQETFGQKNGSVAINTFNEDGKAYVTAFVPEIDSYINQGESDYKVIGNMLITWVKYDPNLPELYTAIEIDIIPNGTELGDIMTSYNPVYGTTVSFLRVKQSLNLTGKVYDYSAAYVTNAKGADEDFTILNTTFNMANIKAGDFDMMYRSVLSCFEFEADLFKYKFRRDDGLEMEFDTPFTVEGNKVTLDMSAVNPACRSVEMYMFQDQDDCQLHMYMPTSAFINYFANLDVIALVTEGKIDPTDAAAVEKVFADMEARVESINVSFVLKARE
ncbi:MAG: hypothetical protein IIW93_02745 [Bacteroidaceae bacterium]|nr:hypothetical protein [Bacteroidaceae bacterium]